MDLLNEFKGTILMPVISPSQEPVQLKVKAYLRLGGGSQGMMATGFLTCLRILG